MLLSLSLSFFLTDSKRARCTGWCLFLLSDVTGSGAGPREATALSGDYDSGVTGTLSVEGQKKGTPWAPDDMTEPRDSFEDRLSNSRRVALESNSYLVMRALTLKPHCLNLE